MLTLKNFTDQLDPDVLDDALALRRKKSFPTLKTTPSGAVALMFPGDVQTSVKTGLKGRIDQASCSCPDFDPADWEENACVHVAAALYALRDGVTPADGKPVKKVKAEKPAKARPTKPKSPEEALLGTLTSDELIAFMRDYFAKSPEFKSYFNLYFSGRAGTEVDYGAMVLQAVKAVLGRRKSLTGSEAGKIALSLRELYQKAVDAEKRGENRTAFLIAFAMLQLGPEVVGRLETSSKKIVDLIENVYGLLGILVNKPGLPGELSLEMAEKVCGFYLGPYAPLSDEFREPTFLLAANAAKTADTVGAFAQRIAQSLTSYAVTDSYWYSRNTFFTVEKLLHLIDLYAGFLEKPAEARKIAEQNRQFFPFFQRLIMIKIKSGQFEEALEEVKQATAGKIKFKQGYPNFNHAVALQLLAHQVVREIEGGPLKRNTAASLFQKSRFSDFDLYEIEKSTTDPEEWRSRVQEYLKQTQRIKMETYDTFHPYLEICLREGAYKIVLETLAINPKARGLWGAYAIPAAKHEPDLFFSKIENFLSNALKNEIPYHVIRLFGLLKESLNLPDGKNRALEILESLIEKHKDNKQQVAWLGKLKAELKA